MFDSTGREPPLVAAKQGPRPSPGPTSRPRFRSCGVLAWRGSMRRMAEEQNRTLVLCSSCKKKRCPVISLEPDGSFVLSDVDQTEPGRVVLTREQAEKLRDGLSQMLLRVNRVEIGFDVVRESQISAQIPGHEGEDAIDRTFRQGNL
jgi:hypothetical protein